METKSLRVRPRSRTINVDGRELTEPYDCCDISKKVEGLCVRCGRYCGPFKPKNDNEEECPSGGMVDTLGSNPSAVLAYWFDSSLGHITETG